MAAKYSPEERRKRRSANAHAQMTAFWAGCTGEARAKRCEQITNPEAQAKSHAAQRTPEFRERRKAWGKAMWADVSPEKRLEVGRLS